MIHLTTPFMPRRQIYGFEVSLPNYQAFLHEQY